MTYDNANDHAAFRESIAAALAGGLSAAEQAAFDAHRAACATCAAEYERARESEAHMTALFTPVRFDGSKTRRKSSPQRFPTISAIA